MRTNIFTKTISCHTPWSHFFQSAFGVLSFLLSITYSYAQVTETFDYTGNEQTWVVPNDVFSVHIKSWGAQGGEGLTNPGGLGGYAEGDLAVSPGDVLYIYVGGMGATITDLSVSGRGFNGGGDARGGSSSPRGAGGGASDVRTGGNSLNNRVIVAGGGGGSGTTNYKGGIGGGLIGGNGIGTDNSGGTQTSGGLSNPGNDCTPGIFGAGGSSHPSYSCGGGGGGWYGGASGSAGGGGSGYIGGVSNGSMTNGLRSGDGLVTITYSTIDNTCANATVMECGDVISGSTIGLTPQDAPFCETAHDGVVGLWYTFKTIAAKMEVTTCNPGTDFETELYLYRGANCNDMECVFISDVDNNCSEPELRSSFSISGLPGNVYFIFVTGAQGATGNFEIFLNCVPNDDCEDAVTLSCGTTYRGATIAAHEDIVPDCGNPGTVRGAWYKHSRSLDYCVQLSTCSEATDFDTHISVYQGDCNGNMICVTENGNDPNCPSDNKSTLEFTALAFTDYYVLVSGQNGEEGLFMLDYECSIVPELMVTCPANLNLPCDAEIPEAAINKEQFVIQGGFISGGSCESGSYFVSNEDIITGNSCDGIQIARNYTITNNYTNISTTCTQIINLAPSPAPVIDCINGVAVSCVEDIFPSMYDVTITSDCPEALITFSDPALNNGRDNCPGAEYVVVYTATDNCGRQATCERVFTIDNQNDFSITCPADLTVYCEDDIDLDPNNAVVITNCNQGYTSYIRNPEINGIPGCNGTTYTYEYVVVDDCERKESCIQTITIQNTPATINAPSGGFVNCFEDIDISPNDATVSGGCADYNLYLTNPQINGELGCPGTTYTYTYRLIDVCGNVVVEDVIFTNGNNEAPTIVAPVDLTIDCMAGLSLNPSNAIVTTACTLGSQVSISDPQINGTPACPGTQYIYTYTVSDHCGRTASDIQVITLQNGPPTFDNCPDDNWLQLNCEDYGSESSTIAVIQAWIYSITASSSCGTPLTVYNDFNHYNIGTCIDDGLTTVNFWATDDCGRTVSCQGTVVVTDTEGPTIFEAAEDHWEVCNNDTQWNFQDWLADQGGAFAEDGCAYQNFTWSTIPENPTFDCEGQNGITSLTVTFVATDNCGNSSSTSATFNAFTVGGNMVQDNNDQIKEERSGLVLNQNHPNPFKDETTIGFYLPKAGKANLIIYDLNGRVIKMIENNYTGGYNEISLNRNELGASGIKYYRLMTEQESVTKSMILLE